MYSMLPQLFEVPVAGHCIFNFSGIVAPKSKSWLSIVFSVFVSSSTASLYTDMALISFCILSMSWVHLSMSASDSLDLCLDLRSFCCSLCNAVNYTEDIARISPFVVRFLVPANAFPCLSTGGSTVLQRSGEPGIRTIFAAMNEFRPTGLY